MTKELPLVSIVTPSYNQGRFIDETILSIKRQDYPNIEHIVVDGESRDNSVEILKIYEGSYNMCWISEPDDGHSDAVNKGFRMAKGDIIGWLNSDDVYIDHSVVRAVVEAFQRHPEVDVIYGDVIFVAEDNTILRVQCIPGFSFRRLLQWCFLEQPAVFFRKKVVESHQLDVSLKVAIDYEYWLRISKECRFYHLPRVLAADRNHAQRISVAQSGELRKVSEQIRNKYGQSRHLWHYLSRGADIILSGLPRRLRGLFVLMLLRRKNDWAFPAKWDDFNRTLQRQLFGCNLKSHLPRVH